MPRPLPANTWWEVGRAGIASFCYVASLNSICGMGERPRQHGGGKRTRGGRRIDVQLLI